MEIERLSEACHDLRQPGRRVGVGAQRTGGAHDELEWRLDLGADVGGGPELRRREDRAQHLADVALRALPRGHGIVHAAVGRIVVHESLDSWRLTWCIVA